MIKPWNICILSMMCFVCLSCTQQQNQSSKNDSEVQTSTEDSAAPQDTTEESTNQKNEAPLLQELSAEQKQQVLASWEKKIGIYQYQIKVDGGSSASGDQVLRISRTDANTWTVESEITIKATLLGLTVYSYTEKSREVWKGTNLESFSDSVDDDGDKCEVNMKAEGGKITGTVNGKPVSLAMPSALALCCWNTSELYPLFSPYRMMYVDSQTLKTDTYQVKEMGAEKISLGSQSVVCKHVTLARPESDHWQMWFLPSGVPAKHVDDVDGHKTEFSLKSWTTRE